MVEPVYVFIAGALAVAVYTIASAVDPQITHPTTQRHTEEARFGGFQIPMKLRMSNQRLVSDPKYKYRALQSWAANAYETRGEYNARVLVVNPNNGLDGEARIYGPTNKFSLYGSPAW